VLRTLLAPCLVLTQNPRTLIQLVAQSLTSTTVDQNPSLEAAFINASSLALLQASSFPMLGVVCAAAVGHMKRHDSDPELTSERFLLDPDAQETRQCDAVGCVAVMFRSRSSSRKGDEEMDEDAEQVRGEIVWSSLHGIPLQSDYDALLRLAKTGAKLVYSAMRDRLGEEIESTSIVDEQLAKKMPKNKGGRVALNVGPEKAMDTT
jgi:exosome complex component RRP46